MGGSERERIFKKNLEARNLKGKELLLLFKPRHGVASRLSLQS